MIRAPLAAAGILPLAMILAGSSAGAPDADEPRAAGPGAAGVEASPPLLFRDQYGRKDGPGRHRGQVVLLIYGGPNSLARMRAWEREVVNHASRKPIVLRVIDARSLQGIETETDVDERLLRRAPPGASILVDWNGDLARAYALPISDVLATVLGRDGRPCGTAAGQVDPEGRLRILAALARAQDAGSCR